MEKISNEKIISTAEILINRKKTSDITLSQIADELGVTHAAIYKHFKNKQSLWEEVAKTWLNRMVQDQISKNTNHPTTKAEELHDWLWGFVNAKKRAYNENPQMFILNTQYVDNNPFALRSVLTDSYKVIDELMAYHDDHYQRAEAILSAFAVFTLPNFKDSWNEPDYQERFENIWNLIKTGI